jgi:hypothetical protein
MAKVPKVGDIVPYWFAPKGTRVLAVRPYDGRYPQWFGAIVTLAAPRTRQGSIETAWPKERAS